MRTETLAEGVTLYCGTISTGEPKMNSLKSCIAAVKEVLSALDGDEKIAAINEIRSAIHDLSPFCKEPVDFIRWIPSDQVTANDYNPNVVAPPEMKLLRIDRKSTRLNSSHVSESRMPSSA